MTKNGLHRHYDRLGPEERFRLDVLAMARGDSVESDRLTRTCPRFTYTMNDRRFAGRWVCVMDITLRVYVDLARHLDGLKMLEAVRVVVPYSETFAADAALDAYLEGHQAGARQAWREAGKKGSAPEWPLEGYDEAKIKQTAAAGTSILPQILDRLERDQAQNALDLWRGFGRFCRERLDLDVHHILRVVLEPAVERVEELESLAERLGIEPDPETVGEIAGGLSEAWQIVDRAA
jgi:hypothetical protein